MPEALIGKPGYVSIGGDSAVSRSRWSASVYRAGERRVTQSQPVRHGGINRVFVRSVAPLRRSGNDNSGMADML